MRGIRVEAFNEACGCWDRLTWFPEEGQKPSYWAIRKFLLTFTTNYSMFAAFDGQSVLCLGNLP